jgi:hypothetical protein
MGGDPADGKDVGSDRHGRKFKKLNRRSVSRKARRTLRHFLLA